MVPMKKVYNQRVHIGESLEKWVQLRKELKVSNDVLAKILLDNYFGKDTTSSYSQTEFLQTSNFNVQTDRTLLSSDFCCQTDVIGINASTSPQIVFRSPRTYLRYQYTKKPSPKTPRSKYGLAVESPCLSSPPTPRGKRKNSTPACGCSAPLKRRLRFSDISPVKEQSQNLGDPSDLENLDDEGDNCTLNFENNFTEATEFADELQQTFGINEESLDSLILENHHQASPLKKIVTQEQIVTQSLVLVNLDSLTKLVKDCYPKRCSECGESLEYRCRDNLGSAIVFSWVCPKNSGSKHTKGQWASQPLFHKCYSGNLLLASCIPLSGNLYSKIAKFFNLAKVKFFGKDTYLRYQEHFICPAVAEYWENMQKNMFQEMAGKQDLIIAGDGRNDSPGHSAMYCTYSLANYETQKVLAFNNRDVRHADGKSPNMEIIAFKLAAQEILNYGDDFKIKIKELVTDGHSSIKKELKNCCQPGAFFKYKLKHSHDIWHGGKNILTKIMEASRQKGCEHLAHWAPHLRNHFWYSALSCEGNSQFMKEIWGTALFHVTNVHFWNIPKADRFGCDHDDLTEDQLSSHPWLKQKSNALRSLRGLVFNEEFTKKMTYFCNFRHTGFIENLHSLMLMYAPKRISFGFQGYSMRITLAVIDHNFHVGRKQAVSKDGTLCDTRRFSKRSKVWHTVKVLEPKTYGYMPELLERIFQKRAIFKDNLKKKTPLGSDDPKKIHPHRGMVDAPSKEELREKQTSRFQ